MPSLARALIAAVAALAVVSPICAQRGGSDWMTSGYDAQRSRWVRADPKISPESMQQPGFQLEWKLPLKNEQRQLNALTPPALFDFYIGYRGFRTLGFVGGSSDNVIAIDTDLARIEWEKNLAPASAGPTPSVACPGGMTSEVTRPTVTGYPAMAGRRGFGRGQPAASAVSEPYQGSVTLQEREARIARLAAAAPPRREPANPRRATPASPFAPVVRYVHAITSDGKFHSMYVSNGDEPDPAVPFLPPNANAQGLLVFDDTAYVATVNGCGGVPNGVWALDLNSKRVTQWEASANIIGSSGPAAGPDGTLYVAAGSKLSSLDSSTLKETAAYTAPRPFTSSPVIFEHGDEKDLIAIATGDGRIQLLDPAALGQKPLFETPAFSTAGYETGALAAWQDEDGTRWVLAPAGGAAAGSAGFASTNGQVTNGAVVAWKVVERGGAAALEPAWASRDMVSPLPPIVINGVVFAVASGEFRGGDANLTAAQRAERSSPAVLYALDATTGKELWSSGDTITSFVHSGGLSGGGSRVYVSTHDGTQYAFGFPIEH
jgi:outer membrane protein assembly factor BamB